MTGYRPCLLRKRNQPTVERNSVYNRTVDDSPIKGPGDQHKKRNKDRQVLVREASAFLPLSVDSFTVYDRARAHTVATPKEISCPGQQPIWFLWLFLLYEPLYSSLSLQKVHTPLRDGSTIPSSLSLSFSWSSTFPFFSPFLLSCSLGLPSQTRPVQSVGPVVHSWSVSLATSRDLV